MISHLEGGSIQVGQSNDEEIVLDCVETGWHCQLHCLPLILKNFLVEHLDEVADRVVTLPEEDDETYDILDNLSDED